MAIGAAVLAVTLAGCPYLDSKVANLKGLMQGRSATVTTYNVFGQKLDRIHGVSVDIQREKAFDSKNEDGSTNKDSSVVSVSVGANVMTHVGLTLLMAEDGLVDVSAALPKTVDLNNFDHGTPFLNYLRQTYSNYWQGKARTIVVRSQNGSPIAIYAGNKVEYFATNVPKSTLLLIDDKYLLIYRSEYTIYDNALLRS